MSTDRLFRRDFDCLGELVDFTREVFRHEQLDQRILPTVDLAIEELFTNMVKYANGAGAAVRVSLEAVSGGVAVTLTDFGVDRFDPTQAPEVDIRAPIERRNPGGLGLHLIRKMVDSIEYGYDEATRQGRITFRKTIPDRRVKKRTGGEVLAIDYGDGGAVVIVGRLDAAQCATAQSFLDKVEGTVKLDCTRLEYISSAGLGVLLKTQKRLMAKGGKLRLAGVNPHLRDIFQYSGFDQIFEIEPAA
ncbi:MAG TPA: anti-sigma factor antagonist [Usitatibacter sp.]|nr:anti-sigma factor antagonist [Usitatibacter sp.]